MLRFGFLDKIPSKYTASLAFLLGLASASILSKFVPDTWVDKAYEILDLKRNKIPNLSGWYYYVTTSEYTHESTLDIFCDDGKKAKQIAGIVKISHSPTIEPTLKFQDGLRTHCSPVKTNNFTLLNPPVHWESEWAMVTDEKIYSVFKLNDGLKSTFFSTINRDSIKDTFSGTLIYVPDLKPIQPFVTTIVFKRCNDQSNCESDLKDKYLANLPKPEKVTFEIQ